MLRAAAPLLLRAASAAAAAGPALPRASHAHLVRLRFGPSIASSLRQLAPIPQPRMPLPAPSWSKRVCEAVSWMHPEQLAWVRAQP